MKKLLTFLAVSTMLIGCARNDADLVQQDRAHNATRSNGISIVMDEDSVLHFQSQEDFLAVMEKLQEMDTHQKIEYVKQLVPGFVSIQEQYDTALHEIDSLVNTEADYEEFKKKYPQFYYANEDGDCGVYIPMEYEELGYLTPASCKLVVGEQSIEKLDMNVYPKLKAQGLTYSSSEMVIDLEAGETIPSHAASDINGTFVFSGTHVDPIPARERFESRWIKDGRRMLKLKSRRHMYRRWIAPGVYLWDGRLHVEICFRKKTGLVWINYRSKTKSNVQASEDNGMTWHNFPTYTESGYSSHDVDFGIPCHVFKDSTGHYVYLFPKLKCKATVEYQGFSKPETFDWSLRGASFTSPYVGGVPIDVIGDWH